MKKFGTYILGLAVIFSSCTETIDFDLNTEKSRLVVEGGITNGKGKHLVRLTKTTSYFDNEPAPAATNANVTISFGDSTWTLIEEEPGNYYTPQVSPQLSNTYTLNIDYEGEKYSASALMPNSVPFDSIVLRVEEGFDFEENKNIQMNNLYLYAKEPEGLGDAYMWKYWVKKPDTAWKDMTPTYDDWAYSDDEFIDGNSPAEGWMIFRNVPKEDLPSGTIIRMEMYKITNDYLTFLDAVGEQTNRSGLFDGPPANIPSNIDNGALGYFMVAGVDTSYTVVP